MLPKLEASLVIFQTESSPKTDQKVVAAYRAAVDDGLVAMADNLQRKSPVGISPTNESLKGSWDIIPASRQRGTLDIRGAVINTSKAAYNRLEGRAPGKFPPFGRGTPLAKWANSKGIPPFLVARKIAREGTDRWQQRSVFEGQGGTSLWNESQVVFQIQFAESLDYHLSNIGSRPRRLRGRRR